MITQNNLIQIKPNLASSEKILPYLKAIDKNRYYSNFGPLYNLSCKKIKKKFKLKKLAPIITSSGHAALQACCFLIKSYSKKKFILVPSFAFFSNAQVIIQSGFEPYFLDINPETLEPNYKDIISLKKKNNNIAAVMLISVNGKINDIEKINNLKKEINCEIIYDCAESFINFNRTIDKANFLLISSFHPTKPFGANESGLIFCKNKYKNKIKTIINFGYESARSKKTKLISREAKYLGFNGKFSEYDAAVFLANFENFEKIKKKLFFLNMLIFSFLKTNDNYLFLKGFGEKWVSNKIYIISKKINFIKIKKKFLTKNINVFTPWSILPLHRQKLFRKFSRTKMDVTNNIIKNIFAIPLNNDLKLHQIKRIISVFKSIK